MREVAARLSVSTAIVYAMVERGDLAHLRISNVIQISRAEVERISRAT